MDLTRIEVALEDGLARGDSVAEHRDESDPADHALIDDELLDPVPLATPPEAATQYAPIFVPADEGESKPTTKSAGGHAKSRR